MGIYFNNLLILQGKSEEIYRFYLNEHDEINGLGFGIEGKNLPNLDEGIEKYHETYCEIYIESKHDNWDFIYYCDDLFNYDKRYQKLKIESYFATEWSLGYEFYRANANKYKFMWTHKSSQNLEKMNKKFKLIKRNDNVVIFEDDKFNGWKDVALDKCGISGHVLLEDKIETHNNQESLIANAILSDKSPNYCGIKDLDIKKSMDLANSIIKFGERNLTENGNLIFKIIKSPELESIIQSLKTKFRYVTQYQFSKSSQSYVIARGFKKSELQMKDFDKKYNLIKSSDSVLIYADTDIIYANDDIKGWEKAVLNKSKNIRIVEKKHVGETFEYNEKLDVILSKAEHDFNDRESFIDCLKEDGNLIMKHVHGVPRCDLLALQEELESRFKSVKIESFPIYKYVHDSYSIKLFKKKFLEDYIIAMGYKGKN